MSKPIDLTGQRFCRLLVIGRLRRQIRCKCECGNICEVDYGNLKSGRTRSCGCLSKESSRKTIITNRRKPTILGMAGAIRGSYIANNKRRKGGPLEFTLTTEQCIPLFTGRCHYCGLPPSNFFRTSKGSYNNISYSGIDRLDTSKGYTKGNCVSCCITCNYAKQSMTETEFLNWIERVFRNRILKERVSHSTTIPAHAPSTRAKHKKGTNSVSSFK